MLLWMVHVHVAHLLLRVVCPGLHFWGTWTLWGCPVWEDGDFEEATRGIVSTFPYIKFQPSHKCAVTCVMLTFITIEVPELWVGRPVRKSSIFPARRVHLRPSRHRDFSPCFENFRSNRSLYLKFRGRYIICQFYIAQSRWYSYQGWCLGGPVGIVGTVTRSYLCCAITFAAVARLHNWTRWVSTRLLRII